MNNRFVFKCFFIVLMTFSSTVLWALPRGNYQGTCRDCRVFYRAGHAYLFCRCLDRTQFTRSTKLKLTRCLYVQNLDGNLTCTRHRLGPSGWHRRYQLVNVSAGPIANNWDAKTKCPLACAHMLHGRSKWTGQWRTVRFAVNSMCQCKVFRRW